MMPKQSSAGKVLAFLPVGLALLAVLAVSAFPVQAASQWNSEEEKMQKKTATSAIAKVTMQEFGQLESGEKVDVYTLENAAGVTARLMTYGATLTELHVPDAQGEIANVVLGFDNLTDFKSKSPYFGATVGRFANRIAGARFSLDGIEYKLVANNGPNTLHGGVRAIDKRVWQATPIEGPDGTSVKFTYTSPDMEEGFPGNLKLEVTYTLSNGSGEGLKTGSQLKIFYKATTDRATPINLTNHAYFNLDGAGNGDILEHELQINADRYTPVDDDLIPTGELAPVKDTAMDFTSPQKIGARIAQVKGGYDHNYVLRSDKDQDGMALAAVCRGPGSGRTLKVLTTEPGVQFYSGNFLDGSAVGIGGAYKKHYGFTLETQHFPDSVHHDNFPDVILRPGQTYTQTTIYSFPQD